jgi:hypothetical protein
MKKAPPKEEAGEKAPLWMISFADMISLLMAFFIMLLTMATTRTGTLCETGSGVFERSIQGFKDSIASFGIPGVFKEKKSMGFLRTLHHFAVDGKEETGGERLIDADEERTKRVFKQLQNQAVATPSSVGGSQALCDVTPIVFSGDALRLQAEDERYLARFCADLKASGSLQETTVIVVGAAPDAANFRDKWAWAAERAKVVAQRMRQEFADTPADVLSWGTADASAWSKEPPASGRPVHILLAVLRKK